MLRVPSGGCAERLGQNRGIRVETQACETTVADRPHVGEGDIDRNTLRPSFSLQPTDRDHLLTRNDAVYRTVLELVGLRVRPEVRKTFHFDCTRIERFVVACYDSAVRGFFGAHRDNTTTATAHRIFAMTLGFLAMTLIYAWMVIHRVRIARLERASFDDDLDAALAARRAEGERVSSPAGVPVP